MWCSSCSFPLKSSLETCFLVPGTCTNAPDTQNGGTCSLWGFFQRRKNDLPITFVFHRLVGLVVKASRPEDRELKSCLWQDISGLSHTSDLKIGTPVATLPGAWLHRVRAGTGRPGVSILWLGEVESLICNFYLSVAARKIVWADLSLRYTRILLGR